MIRKKKPQGFWTKERCFKEAKKYKTRNEFKKMSRSAYSKAHAEGWINHICSHMKSQKRNFSSWTKKELGAIAKKYSYRSEFRKHEPTASKIADKLGIMDKICSHMFKKNIESKYHIEDLKKYAAEKEGKCHSLEYISKSTKYSWECKDRHRWKATWGSIFHQSTWCKECSKKIIGDKNRKWSTEDLIIVVKKMKGELLSTSYENANSKCRFKCDKEHIWETKAINVLRGSWCHDCAGIKSHTINMLKEYAKKKGGECLSSKYTGSNGPYLWSCSKGHQWETTWASINRAGTWCRICSYKARGIRQYGYSIKELQKLAIEQGGECLSKEYQGVFTKYKWKCEKGHVFVRAFSDIRDGMWCQKCSRVNLQKRFQGYTVNDLQNFADNLGGKFLSTEYLNKHTKYEWECGYGHKWKASAHSILNGGSWCSTCSSGLNEGLTRIIFQSLLKAQFKKARPAFLKGFELDGYNEKFNLAFEYNGIQHYEKGFFTKTNDDLKKRRLDDNKKIKLCRENGVKLIIIPYFDFDNLSIKEKISYISKLIKSALKRERLKKIDLKSLQVLSPKAQSYYERALYISALKGWEFLGPKFINLNEKYKWRCSCGYIWEAKLHQAEDRQQCTMCRKDS